MRSFVAGLLLLIAGQTNAAVVTQTFTSSWAIDVWNYNGDVAAMQWKYVAYDPSHSSLGVLDQVRVETTITGQRALASEATRIRYAFFTGWAPDDFQLNREFYIAGGTSSLAFSETLVYNTRNDLQNWTDYSYFPPANYYFESRTVSAGHSVDATTTLTLVYSQQVPEPSTILLVLASLLSAAAKRPFKKNALRLRTV